MLSAHRLSSGTPRSVPDSQACTCLKRPALMLFVSSVAVGGAGDTSGRMDNTLGGPAHSCGGGCGRGCCGAHLPHAAQQVGPCSSAADQMRALILHCPERRAQHMWLLHSMMPKTVINALRTEGTFAQTCECTVIFADGERASPVSRACMHGIIRPAARPHLQSLDSLASALAWSRSKL